MENDTLNTASNFFHQIDSTVWIAIHSVAVLTLICGIYLQYTKKVKNSTESNFELDSVESKEISSDTRHQSTSHSFKNEKIIYFCNTKN